MEQMMGLYRFIQNSDMSEEAVRFVHENMQKLEGMRV